MSGPQVIEDPARQQLLEDAHAQGAAPGDAMNWELHLGKHRLLLVPTTGAWLFLNTVHDSWDPTGFKAGEVTFRVVDGNLGYKR